MKMACVCQQRVDKENKSQGQLVYVLLLSQSAAGKALIDQTLPWESWLCRAAASVWPSLSASIALLEVFSVLCFLLVLLLST